MSKLDDFLMHYVEQPYDPVKAHEYYIKNRDLKGRSTGGMSDKQKEAWSYAQNNITEDKKRKVESAKVANEQKIEAFRAAAEATRKRISDKLKIISERLSDKATDDMEAISDKLKTDIENVPDIPKGVKGEQRERLIIKRKQKIEEIMGRASKHRGSLSNATKKERLNSSEEASTEREKTSTDLKKIISKTMDDYSKAKEALNTSYEAIYAKEYRKVLDTIEGKAKSKPKGKGKGKGSGKAKKPKEEKQGKIIYYTKSEMDYNRKH